MRGIALLLTVAMAVLLLASTAYAQHANPGNAQHLGSVDEVPPRITEAEVSGEEGEHGEAESDAEDAFFDPRDYVNAAETSAPARDEYWTDPHAAECGCKTCCERLGVEFFGPVALINTHPPNLMFLSPAADVATTLCPGESYFRLAIDESSIITRELDSGIIADYDMELLRFTADYHQALGSGELYAQLPLNYHWAGIQDGIIESWHRFFGLPNGLRDTLPDDEYSYVVVTRQGPAINDQGGLGLGDLTVGYKHPLWDSGNGEDAAAVRAAVKLPIGDKGRHYSSGNIDASLGALYQRQLTPHIRLYGNYDYIFAGEPDLENIAHQNYQVLLLASEYVIGNNTSLTAQYQLHGNPLVVGSREADKDPQQLALGFNHRINGGLVWSGGFTEDIYPETAPDFVVFTQFRWDF